jgi:hypothetical protein
MAQAKKIAAWGVFGPDGKLAHWAGGTTPVVLATRSQFVEYGWNVNDFKIKRIEIHVVK